MAEWTHDAKFHRNLFNIFYIELRLTDGAQLPLHLL